MNYTLLEVIFPLTNFLDTSNNLTVVIQDNLEKDVTEKSLSQKAENEEQKDTKLSEVMGSNLYGSSFPGTKDYAKYEVARLGIEPLTDVLPLDPEYGTDVINDVLSIQFEISVKACDNSVTLKSLSNAASSNRHQHSSLFVAIISAPKNTKKRERIRATWLRHLRYLQSQSNRSSIHVVGYGFIIGQTEDEKLKTQIEEESEKHGDILPVDIIDAYYYNMSIKVAALMSWLQQNCNQVDYVFKVDDDVYVNLHNLKLVVGALNKTEKSVYGFPALSYPARGESNKWNLSYEEWPWNNYPPYLMGAALLIPGVVVRPLLAATQLVPYFRFDDAYLLGLCANLAEIKVQTLQSFFTGEVIHVPHPCYVNEFVAWLLEPLDDMTSSHKATEDFYANRTRCIIKESKGVKIVGPKRSYQYE